MYKKRELMTTLNAEMQKIEARNKLEIKAHVSLPDIGNTPPRVLLEEGAFVSMLYLERRRAERAQKRFVLMLIDIKPILVEGQKNGTIAKIASALTNATRETDILGWYLENNLIG